MKIQEAYIPVSCDFVDQIEILATQRASVEILYLDINDKESLIVDLIKTWETVDKVEYLLTFGGQRIRLDRVLKLNNFENSGTCSV